MAADGVAGWLVTEFWTVAAVDDGFAEERLVVVGHKT
jgi:hypothetical protein